MILIIVNTEYRPDVYTVAGFMSGRAGTGTRRSGCGGDFACRDILEDYHAPDELFSFAEDGHGHEA